MKLWGFTFLIYFILSSVNLSTLNSCSTSFSSAISLLTSAPYKKIIAEKINVFLNLLFHLEDYINNQQQREEQLHINEIVKSLLSEVASSETAKIFFYRGADVNNEIADEKEVEQEFRVDKLTDDKIKYIKKVNPQSFNQKNLEVVNYFYNSSGEADMIYDILKMKIFSTIKFCLTHIMQKKYKEKEKQIYSKINFALINKNNYYRKKENLILPKNRSISNAKERFISRPNFIIPPPIVEANFKNKNFPVIKKNNKNIINAYNKTGFAKNYKLIQPYMKGKDEEKSSNILSSYNCFYKNKKQIKIPPESQLGLINVLHNMKKKPIFKNKEISNKKGFKNNNIKIEDNNLMNNTNIEDVTDIKQYKKNKGEKRYYLKKNANNKKEMNYSNEFDYNKVFNMFDALKKRGYLYWLGFIV